MLGRSPPCSPPWALAALLLLFAAYAPRVEGAYDMLVLNRLVPQGEAAWPGARYRSWAGTL